LGLARFDLIGDRHCLLNPLNLQYSVVYHKHALPTTSGSRHK
jgi:hypothetical protein